MASRSGIRNPAWKDDEQLKTDINDLVLGGYTRGEALIVLKKRYPQYAWSLGSLKTRLSHFKIRFSKDVPLGDVYDAVEEELEGPGKNLGYRSMHAKIRKTHGLFVPRDIVYDVLRHLDQEGLTRRGGVGISKKKKRNAVFKSAGPDFLMSLDGHDKLCGYQKSMFPLCIYGGQDSYSGKIQFLRIWNTNNNPNVVGRFYTEYLLESRTVPRTIRVDKGTETGVMAELQCQFHIMHETFGDDLETITKSAVRYGPSTANKIERFWKDLHERFEEFFKMQLKDLVDSGWYCSKNKLDRMMLAYVYIPVIQRELDIFRRDVWNGKRSRSNPNKALPTGIPDFLYENPEVHGYEEWGLNISDDDMKIVLEQYPNIFDHDDYLEPSERESFELILPTDDELPPKDAVSEYKMLKTAYSRLYPSTVASAASDAASTTDSPSSSVA